MMKHILSQIFKLLTFRLSREEMIGFDKKLFIAGLIGTWIVGMGRYWDDPGANIIQHLGLGSVIYIFALAALVWVVFLPFQVENWTYFRVVTFISLTSFPAIFYAIPVEQFFTMETANQINVWFLAVVAIWRLSLLIFFVNRFTQLNGFYTIVSSFLPVVLIIASLTALNLHRVIFNIMGGQTNPSEHDLSYTILMLLTFLSVVLVGPLLITYIISIVVRRKKLKRAELEVSNEEISIESGA